MSIATEENTQRSRGLTVREMARQSGLSEHTLRYYERIGLIAPIERDVSSNHRRYAPDTVASVEILACLRGAGMPICDLRRLIELSGSELSREQIAELKAICSARAAALRADIAAMQERAAYLDGKTAYFDALADGDDERARAIMASNEHLAAAVAAQIKNRKRRSGK